MRHEWTLELLNDKPIPDTIGVSMETRESLRRASQSVTTLVIPGYELTKEIGKGNFGTVWQAERKKTGQRVAIKIVDLENDLDWTYFRRELDFLRELEEHPNTLTILDAQLDAEPPYIVMPLADGGSLEEKVRKERPNLELIERWLTQMAEALVFIHRKGVIHCDFKPSNVLLTSDDHVRVADLGQARRTGHGVALGTIGFMAPEQCSEKTKASPSVSWDVYGYGATAYWLLTGKVPRTSGGQPTTLGEYIECFSTTKLTPIRQLNPDIDPELAAIVESCLEVDHDKRIPSIDSVLVDLKRRQENQPLLCKKPWPLFYVVRTALKRRPIQVFVAALLIGFVAAIFAWKGRQENRYLTHLTAGIHAHESGRIEEAYLQWVEALEFDSDNQALSTRLDFMPLEQIYPHRSRVTDLGLADNGNTLISSSADGEVAFWNVESGEKTALLEHPDYVSGLVISEEKNLIATASWDGNARIFELGASKPRAILSHGKDTSVGSLTFCDSGKLLASADLQGQVRLWDSESGQEIKLESPPVAPYVQQHLASHPKEPLLAALSDFNVIGLWTLVGKTKLPFVFQHDEEINDLCFTPEGDHLISASDDNMASVWDLKTGKKVRDFPHDSRVNKVLALGDGRFVTGCEDGSAIVWSLQSEESIQQFFHRRPVKSLAANEDKTLVAVGTGEAEHLWSDIEANGTVRVWDLKHGYEVSGPWPHDGPIQSLLFARQKPHVLTASGSARQNTAAHPGAVRSWHYILPEIVEKTPPFKAREQEPQTSIQLSNGVILAHGNNVAINQSTMNPDETVVATASSDQTVRLWMVADGSPASNPLLLDGAAQAVCFNQEGTLIATASRPSDNHSVVQVWEVTTGYPVTPPLPCPDFIKQLTFSDHGGALFAKGEDKKYRWSLHRTIDTTVGSRKIPERLRVQLDQRGSVIPN